MNGYIGRFAPSPTGPLHIGSLYTAVASYLDAKANNGKWLLRIEDIDPPREQAGSTRSIIASLLAHGLNWDGEIIFQSRHSLAYEKTIRALQEKNLCYYCQCTRQELQPFGENYPGFCRKKRSYEPERCTIRLVANPPAQAFEDRLLGRQLPPPVKDGLFNDFVIKRKDGLYAYQLAVVVDDIEQGVNSIVRGSDILDSTYRQNYLYQYLGQPRPDYLHLPVITSPERQKLSKQNLAPPINDKQSQQNLLQVLRLLNQEPPPANSCSSNHTILGWAISHWDISRIPRKLSISPYDIS